MKIIPKYQSPPPKNTKRRDIKDFLHSLYIKNNNIMIIDRYVSAHYKMKSYCNICKHTWKRTPNGYSKNVNCIRCIGRYQYTPEEFKILYINKIDDPVELLSDYINNDTSILCRCPHCGYEYNCKPSNLLSGKKCKKCQYQKNGERLRKSQERFINEVGKLHPLVLVIGEYTTCKDNIKCKCLICNQIFETNASYLLNKDSFKNGCTKCLVSLGERKIAQFLDHYKIKYVAQKKYKGLLGLSNMPLSYDFYLNELNILIEFQGIQHYKPIEIFGGEKAFIKQQEHDKRKREYAKNNNIKLIEISYLEIENIEEILKNELNLGSVETAGCA